jgi:PAS domain S-box-containing protein
MKSHINSEISNLRKKAEKLLKSRQKDLEGQPSEGSVLKLLHELDVCNIEFELQNEELASTLEANQDVVKNYQISEPDMQKLIHEIEVSKIELELKHLELEFSKTVSQDVAERYIDLFHFSTSGYLVLTNEGEIIDLNTSGVQMLGKERLSLKNSRFGFFVADEYKPVFNNFLEKLFSSKLRSSCELMLMLEDFNYRYVNLTGIITQNEQQCLITLVDITEQKYIEIYKDMASKILRILNEGEDLKDIIARVLNEFKVGLGLDAVGLRLKHGVDFPYFVQDGYSESFLSSENSLIQPDKNGKVCKDDIGSPQLDCICGQVISGSIDKSNSHVTTFGSWWSNDSNLISELYTKKGKKVNTRNSCFLQGFISGVLIPLKTNSETVGLLQLNSRRKGRFSLSTIEILEGIATNIGAVILRKKAEETLRKSENLLRTITDNAPDLLLQVNREGTILYINHEMYGLKQMDCVGKNFCHWALPEYREMMRQTLETVFKSGTTQMYQSQEEDQNGDIHWIRTSLSPEKINNNVESVVLVSRDITSILKDEETIRINLERHKTIIQTAIDGFWMVDKDGRIIDVNESYCRMSGYSSHELLTLRIADIEVIDTEIDIETRIQKIIKNGEERFETQHRRKDGSVFQVEVNVQYQWANGECFVVFIHDITKRKQNERNILENEKRYRSIFQDNQSVMLLVNPETGEIIDANPAACNYYGWTHDEMCAKKITEINTLPTNKVIEEMLKAKDKRQNHFFFQHRLCNNEIRDVEVFSGPIQYGDIQILFSIVHDITDRKQAEEALYKSREQYSLINNSSRDSIFSYDLQGRFTSANRSLCELMQLEEAQIIGKTHADLGYPLHLQVEWNDLHQKVYETNSSLIAETTAPVLDGSIRDYEVVLNPLHDQSGTIIGFGGSARDITERKLAEKQLRQSEGRYKSLFQENQSVMVILNPENGDIKDANAAASQYYGWSHSELCQMNIYEINFFPDEESERVFQKAKAENRKHLFFKHRLANGEIRDVEAYLGPIQIADSTLLYAIIHDITESKKLENALRDSEQKFSEIYNSMTDGLAIHDVIYDKDGNIIDSIIYEVNPAFEKIIEINREYFIGKKVSETIISQMQLFIDYYRNVESLGQPAYFDFFDSRTNKYLSFTVFTYAKGKFVTVIRNISFQKQAEEAIIKSERKLADIYASMSEGMAIHELLYDESGNATDYKILEINPAYETITGLKREAVIGKNATIIYNVDHAPYIDLFSQVAITGNSAFFESYSSDIKKYLSISVFSPEKGKFATVFQDVTERKLAEEALRLSENKFRTLVSDMQVGVLLQGADAEILMCNPKAQELLGMSEEQILGKTSYDSYWVTIHEDGSPFPGNETPVPQAIATGKTVRNVVLGVKNAITNNLVWLLVDAVPQYEVNGTVSQVVCTLIDITELKRIEEERKYLLVAVQNMDSIMTVKDLNLRVISGNNAFLKAIGHETIQTAIGKTDAELWNVTPDTEPIHTYMEDERNAQKLAQGEYILREEPLIMPNGEIRMLLTKKYPIYDDNGNLICTSNISIDITERKRMENALREREDRLKHHFENSPLAVVEWNSNSIITEWSKEAERIFGWRKKDVIGKRIDMPHMIYEKDIPVVNSVLKRLASGNEEIVVSTNRNVTKSGEVLVCTWYNSVLLDEKGKMTSVMSLIQDVTNEKKAEEALRESEEKFSLVFEKSPYVIVLSSQSEGLVDVNEAFVNTFGVSKEDARGKEIQELGFDFNPELMEKIILEIGNNGFVHNLESVFKDKSGENRIFRFNVDTIQSGNKNYTLTTAEDITKRKVIEEALRESEFLIRESQKAAFIGSYKTNFKTGIWESTDVLNQIFGIDSSFVRSIDGWLNITHPDDRKMLNEYILKEVLRKRLPFNKEYRIIRVNDGEVRWVHVMGKIGYDSNNSVESLVGTVQDITERKRKEESLRKLNKVLVVLSKSSHLMTQSLSEAEYLKQVCQIVVEDTDFPMVWIGFAQDNDVKAILPVASAGFTDDYLEMIKLSWDDSKHGRGPSGTVIRTGTMSICNNMYKDPTFEPWREHALKRGFASSSVFPLSAANKTFGAISIYSHEPDAFLDIEIQMFSELANDLAQGVTNIRLREAHKMAEKALSKSYSELAVLVKERTRELQITNDLLVKEINIRKQQEQSLKMAEEKYRTVADFATNWEFWISQNDIMLYCSPSCERITGYTASEFINDSTLMNSIIHSDDLEFYLVHQRKELKAQYCDHEVQYRIIRKDGKIRWMGHYCRPIFDNAGQFNGTRGSNKDITSRKKMEELLKASNRKYNLLSENISDGIFILKRGCFEYVNKSVNDLFEYSKDELEGTKLIEFVVPGQQQELDEFIHSVSTKNQSKTFEVECLKRDGSVIHVELILNYIAAEKVIYGVIQDITEKKLMQKNIVKAIIKTEEKERAYFSKELHDGLGPLLSTIKLYLQCAERPNTKMTHKEIIKNAEEILEEAISTVREISNKLSPNLLVRFGLNSAIKSFVDKLRITSTIDIVFESNYKIRVNDEIEATLYRAVIECLNNSIKHSGAKRITIQINETVDLLHIIYTDDGVGFDVSEKISENKGLGLFNLQNRINTVGGRLIMNSKPDSGVEYQFFINII